MFVLTTKSSTNHPQKFLRIPWIHFFPLLPKRPKKKNSCSKMWPIDQLYIELGVPSFKASTQSLQSTQAVKIKFQKSCSSNLNHPRYFKNHVQIDRALNCTLKIVEIINFQNFEYKANELIGYNVCLRHSVNEYAQVSRCK